MTDQKLFKTVTLNPNSIKHTPNSNIGNISFVQELESTGVEKDFKTLLEEFAYNSNQIQEVIYNIASCISSLHSHPFLPKKEDENFKGIEKSNYNIYSNFLDILYLQQNNLKELIEIQNKLNQIL